MKAGSWLIVVGLSAAAVAVHARADNGPLSETFVNWADHPAIQYNTRATTDPVAELIRKIQAGTIQLRRDVASGYLQSVLDALHVPVDSQMMVFEKDSVQASRISPQNPRSLFFNDAVAVGWVRGGFIEFASQDPRQGVIFYTLKQSLAGEPTITRNNDCLSCHYAYPSLGVPGMLDRSARQFVVSHRIPFEKRWGGWYVTGQHGAAHHLGNTDLAHVFDEPPPGGTSNWPSLDGKVDTSGYLAPQSDIVALLVFEHQRYMMNLLTRIGWEARITEYRQRVAPAEARAAGDDPSDHPVSMDDAASEVVDYLLFVDEALFPAPVRGATAFATHFADEGPRDRQGRSLRQLDLQRRLFKYPCSYLIYSQQFEQLPTLAKTAIYRRLWAVLSGQDLDTRYARLTMADRTAIVDILRDTKPDFRAYAQPLRTARR